MPLSLTVARVDRTPTGGFNLVAPDGSGKEFADLAALQAFAADNAITPDNLWAIAIAHWLTKSPDASDDSKIEGKSFDYDPAQNLAVVQVS
jgi:hypothetical protein